MKFNAINKMFTEKVAEYIAKGYIINTGTMGGSQGEIGKVDLVKDKELIRIWLNSESAGNWMDDNAFHGNMVFLRVSKWNQEFTNHNFDTVWMRDLTHLEELKFYKVDTYKDWYIDDLDEAIKFQKIRQSRYFDKPFKNAPEYLEMTDAVKEIASNIMKRKHGYSRISRDELRVRKSNKGYTVLYRDRSYKLS